MGLLLGEGEVHPEQVGSCRSTQPHIQIRVTNQPMNHIVGLWEEAEVSGEGPSMHEGDIQTPHRRDLARNQGLPAVR